MDEAQAAALAEELGVDPAELARVEENATEHLERGRGYLRHDLPDDALTELVEARALAPWRGDVAVELARAYAARWRRDGEEADRREAESLARARIAEDPRSDAAYAVLRSLRRRPWPRGRIALVTGAGAALATGLGFYLSKPSAAPGQPAIPQDTPPAVAAPPSAPTPAETPQPIAPEGYTTEQFELSDGALPLAFALPPDLSGVGLAAVRSVHRVHSDNAFYEIRALLRNDSKLELGETKATLVMLDASGAPFDRVRFDVLPGYLEGLRPGDAHGFHHLTRTRAELSGVVLLLDGAEHRPAPDSYPRARPITPTWDEPAPAGVSLAVRLREDHQNPNIGGKVFHRLALEVENTGSQTLDRVRVEKRLTKDGVVIDRDLGWVVSSTDPPLPPGGVRLVPLISITLPFDAWEVAVLEAR